MPHIVVEYSKNLEDHVDIPNMLTDMHQALAREDGDEKRIKTRATAVNHNVVGEAEANAGQMVHIELRLLEGRDGATKKRYAKPVHAAAKNAVQESYPDAAVTLEVRDMVRETYIL